MADSAFSLDETLSSSWEIYKKKFWRYLAMLGLAGIFVCVPAALAGISRFAVTKGLQQFLAVLLFSVIAGFVAMIMKLGMDYICLQFLYGETPDSKSLWKPVPITFPYIGATIIFLCGWGLGTVLFVVPGFYFYMRFQFYLYFMLEYKCGPIQSLLASWECTRDSQWELVLFCLVQNFIEWAGTLPFGLLTLPAIMYTKLAEAKAYRILHDNAVPDAMPFALNQTKKETAGEQSI